MARTYPRGARTGRTRCGGGPSGKHPDVRAQAPPTCPPPLPGPPLLRQEWVDVSFVHWAVEPADVAPLLPEGTRPDTLDGLTYVGLVAFRVPSTVVLGVVPLGAFTEVNVRLYSIDDHGRRGVVFLTMDADSAHVVAAARAVAGLPYVWSDVSLRRGRNGRRVGAVRRRVPGPETGSWSLRIGEPLAAPDTLARFLTARWGLHTRLLGRTRWLRVGHRPWPLHRATLLHHEGGLLSAVGVRPIDVQPVSVLWAPGVSSFFTPAEVLPRFRRGTGEWPRCRGGGSRTARLGCCGDRSATPGGGGRARTRTGPHRELGAHLERDHRGRTPPRPGGPSAGGALLTGVVGDIPEGRFFFERLRCEKNSPSRLQRFLK